MQMCSHTALKQENDYAGDPSTTRSKHIDGACDKGKTASCVTSGGCILETSFEMSDSWAKPGKVPSLIRTSPILIGQLLRLLETVLAVRATANDVEADCGGYNTHPKGIARYHTARQTQCHFDGENKKTWFGRATWNPSRSE